MEKIVSAGSKACSVTLDGTECAVMFSAEWSAFAVRNNGSSTVHIALKSGCSEGGDGVVSVPSGGSYVYYHGMALGTCYILGESGGKVTVIAQNTAANPFKTAAKGGESIDYTQNFAVAFELLGIDIPPQTDSPALIRAVADICKSRFYFDSTGVIFTYFDRTVAKLYNDPCYAAWLHNEGNWFIPIFVGKTYNSVIFQMFGTTIDPPVGTVTDSSGETWYYNAANYGSYQGVSPAEGRFYLGQYNTSEFDQAAQDLLALVNKWQTYLDI